MRDLDPVIKKARRFLDKAVKPVKKAAGLLKNALVPAAKRLQPLIRRLESTGQELQAWFRRDPRRSGVLLLILLAFVFAVAFSGSGPRYYRALFASGRIAPLPDQQREAAREMANDLALTLDSGVDKKGKFGKQTLTAAQVLLALRQGDPRYADEVDSRLMGNFFRSAAGPECACWRKFPQGRYPNNVGITAWVLWNLAAYGIPAQKGEAVFLLSSQDRRGGWWPMFAGATKEGFASSYATAAAIVALHAQSAFETNKDLRQRMLNAVQLGASWLQAQAAGKARWADYPAWSENAKREVFLGVSGFVLFALHQVGAPGLAELDRDWLGDLPAEIPAAKSFEISNKPIQSGRRSYADDTRYRGLPWGILATVVAYPNGSVSAKVRAMQWLEQAFAPGASIYDAADAQDEGLAAEVLFALRNYSEVAAND